MEKTKIFGKLLISAIVSLLVLSLTFRLVTALDRSINKGHLFYILQKASLVLITFYVLFSLLQAFFRAWRYRFILRISGEKNIPSPFHMFLVTLVRNMCVDILPARTGELGYIALLNRGYSVSGHNALSSLALSFFFDILALSFIFFLLIIHYALRGGLEISVWQTVMAMVAGILFLGFCLFYGLKIFLRVFAWLEEKFKNKRYLENTFVFLHRLADSIEKMKSVQSLIHTLFLSFAVRIGKYMGFYFVFLAVALPFSPQLAQANPGDIFLSLITAEGAAAIPVPSFLGFGPYEAGGVTALTVLGFSAAQSMLILLAVHIISQFFDYSLGLLAFILFLFLGYRSVMDRSKKQRLSLIKKIAAVSAVLFVLLFLGLEARSFKKIGALAAPAKGEKVFPSAQEREKLKKLTGNLNGFIVWSTNRDGSHDIFMMKLPELSIYRLTDHPFTEYFPRISPNGKKIVFCRSQSEWVSQRDYLHWDVYVMDLNTKKETFIANYANTPTWSEDGKKLYFQYKETMFAEFDLEKEKMTVLFEAGRFPLPEGVFLETPHFNSVFEELAVTLRGERYDMALVPLEGELFSLGRGCQIAWSPDSFFLYFVESEDVHQYILAEKKKQLFLDLPEPFTHQYFPKLDAEGRYMVLGASSSGHEHDTADYEIFLWKVGTPAEESARVTFHTGNDNWPDIFLSLK
ncbi:MAG: flippase-like domain-containing protein [Candidatus Aureabacteria bacterium]|nr:flippase-like domain-containing protein [Candidatus Auribacterota bacterium]